MESNELLDMIQSLPPGSKKEVEDLVETLSNKKDEVSTGREFGA